MSEPAHTYVIVAPPRSASTALARILWQHRAVRFYAHEPYGAVYHEGAPPATAEEALREPVDLDETVGGKSAEATGLVVKEMTFQVGRCFPDLAAHTARPVVFNVRDPRLCIASRMEMRRRQGLPETFPLNESGWSDLEWQLSWCRERAVAYRVVDATELRRHPELVAPPLLESLGLDFDESLLHWTPVRPETVRAVADQGAWYERVLSSKGLEREDELIPEVTSFPAELGFREHVEWCCGVYEALQRDAFLIGADRAR